MTAPDVHQPVTRLVRTKNQPSDFLLQRSRWNGDTQQEAGGATANVARCIWHCGITLEFQASGQRSMTTLRRMPKAATLAFILPALMSALLTACSMTEQDSPIEGAKPTPAANPSSRSAVPNPDLSAPATPGTIASPAPIPAELPRAPPGPTARPVRVSRTRWGLLPGGGPGESQFGLFTHLRTAKRRHCGMLGPGLGGTVLGTRQHVHGNQRLQRPFVRSLCPGRSGMLGPGTEPGPRPLHENR